MQLNPTTLVFEVINFLLLVWLLRKLLYRPLRDAIHARELALESERAQTERALTEAEALKQQWEDKNRELVALADNVRNEALADAVAEQGRMLTRAREEAAAEHGKAEALLHAEREAAEQWVKALAIERSTDLAGKMLCLLAPDTVDGVLTERLLQELEARAGELLPQAGASGELSVEVVGAHMPPTEVLDRLRTALASASAAPVQLSVREDPSVRGGLSVRVGDRVLDATLEGQLQAFAHLARELADGGAAHG